MNSLRTEETLIDTPRGKIFAKRWGPPPAPDAPASIILLHDSLGSVELWRDFPPRLAAASGRTVIAYDRLGFGKSDPHPDPIALTFIRDEAAAAFQAVVSHYGIARYVIFGHSVGGVMGVEIAAQFPRQCAALITESAQAFVEDRTREGIIAAQQMFAQPGQMQRLQRYHGDKAQWVLDSWVNTWLSPAFTHWSLDEPLRAVSCPVLALHGDQDEYGSPEHPRRIANGVRGPATAHLFENGGHLPHRENPDAVIKLVVDWLEKSP